MERFTRFMTQNGDLKTLQGRVVSAFNRLSSWCYAITLKDQVLASGSNTISHGLGVEIQGWEIIRPRASAALSMPVETASDDKTLTLDAAGDMTVDIRVW